MLLFYIKGPLLLTLTKEVFNSYNEFLIIIIVIINFKRLVIEHESVNAVILVGQYGSRSAFHLECVQQFSSVQENGFPAKRLAWAETLP